MGNTKTGGFKGEERKSVGLTMDNLNLSPINLLFPINHYHSSQSTTTADIFAPPNCHRKKRRRK